MSKIIVTARTLNARMHLARFLYGYDWADKILIADGGSEDGTQEFLSSHPKVEVRNYDVVVEHPVSQIRRNPEGSHINFLMDWAEAEDADWIIHDDIDSTPTQWLRYTGRQVIEASGADSLWVFRMYLWGTSKWFPRLTGDSYFPEDKWTGLWAWRRGLVRWNEEDPFKCEFVDPFLEGITRQLIYYPSALLHYFCLNEEIVEQKTKFYQGTLEGGYVHPLQSCGPLKELPEWAHP